MTNFNQPFEELMYAGVEAQAQGQHEQALEQRTEAFWSAKTDVEVGRALRDGSASHAKMGEFLEAFEGAIASEEVLRGAGNQREYAVSLAHHARLMAHTAIQNELTGETFDIGQIRLRRMTEGAPEKMEAAIGLLDKHDKYYKNFIGRLAAIYAVNDRHIKSVWSGIKAIPAAVMSETPHNVTSTPNMSRHARLRAKAMHLGVVGCAFGATVSPTRRGTLVLADKALG